MFGVGGILARARAWRTREISLAGLRSLDDRTLADIGLRREQIPLLSAGMPLRSGGHRAFMRSGGEEADRVSRHLQESKWEPRGSRSRSA
jgi:uncharacterized protein YjiS (DUF1127 family)